MMCESNIEQAIQEFRRELPSKCLTAQAIDQHEAWDTIAGKAVVDGYVDGVEKFRDLVEAVVGHPV